MIAEQIYNGATAKELNIPQNKYDSRVKTLNEFLKVWNKKDFKSEYLKWLSSEYNKDVYIKTKDNVDVSKQSCCGGNKEVDLSYGEMFADFSKNIKSIIKSGIKVVDVLTHENRYKECKKCSNLTKSGRCSICGCFMKIKSKFAAMSCPIDKW